MHKFRRLAERVALIFCFFTSAAWAETTFYAPSPLEGELEPEYAKAILKFKAGVSEDAVRALEALREKLTGPSKNRDTRRIYELEALARANQDDAQRVRELHSKILDLVKEQGAPETEAAPSYFAIALADLKLSKAKEARTGFERAHALRYNVPACHLLLGYLDYQERDLSGAARRLSKVVSAPVPQEVRGLAALYLARIAAVQGRGVPALRYAEVARDLSPDSRVKVQAEEIISSAAMAEGFHETAGIDFRFDSNSAYLPIALNPTDSGFASNDGPTGFGNELDLWLGYVSSPLNTWQWSLASRSDILAHWTPAARFADFFDQRLDFVLSHRPLHDASFGLKLGAESLWTTEDLSPYRLRGNLGVYYRRELRTELVLLAELTWHPTRSFQDLHLPGSGTSTGSAADLRVSLYSDSTQTWWNPGASVWFENDHVSASNEFHSQTLGLDLNDLFFASESWKGSFGASIGISQYVDHPGRTRTDPFIGFSASAQYTLSWRYFLRGMASFIDDFSNIGEPYRFNRSILSAGFGINI